MSFLLLIYLQLLLQNESLLSSFDSLFLSRVCLCRKLKFNSDIVKVRYYLD